MALKLLVTNTVGITTEYHRIVGLELNEKLKVTVSSYADETYRTKEKTNSDTIVELNSVMEQIDTELAKPEEERDVELIIELTNRNNELVNLANMPDARYNVFTSEYEFVKKPDMDIDFTYLYEKLKELPEFTDAEDV